MTFVFGAKSEAELRGVDPRLVAIVRLALPLSPVDFAVHDGLRTQAEQDAYLRAGTTTVKHSKHMDGKAVDLVPYINGKLRWEWPPLFEIAHAMQKALADHNFGKAPADQVELIWGGCWDRKLSQIGDPGAACDAYVARRRAMGKRAFIDGPHFEVA